MDMKLVTQHLALHDRAIITFIHPVITAQSHAKVGLPFSDTPCINTKIIKFILFSLEGQNLARQPVIIISTGLDYSHHSTQFY